MSCDQHAVLLFHGLKSNPFELRSVTQALIARGHPVFVPHIPGYADTPLGSRPGNWHSWLRQALREFDALADKYPRVSVGGLSGGASLAMALAIHRHERVFSAVLLSLTLFYDGWATPWTTRLRHIGYYSPLRWFWRVREREPYGVKNVALRRWIKNAMLAKNTSHAGAAMLPLNGIHEVERMAHFVRRHVARFEKPVLMLHARQDEVTSLRSPEYLMERLRHPGKTLLVLENSYHMITLDNDRAQVSQAVCDFLNTSDTLEPPKAKELDISTDRPRTGRG